MYQGQFTVLSKVYDSLNGADYKGYTDYIKKVFMRYGSGKEKLLLDLACGTGKLTEELAENGFDMIGADISTDMLSQALENASEKGLDILYLCQDMCSFELYGTVDAVVCALDGVNYLTKRDDVVKCFKLVRNYLNPGALFLFDVNSSYRFREVFAQRDYFLEGDGNYLGWKSSFDPESGLCDFFLTLFTEDKDGRYTKSEELQTEKLWEDEELERILKETGMELVDIFSGFDMKRPDERTEKKFYVCRCPFDK